MGAAASLFIRSNSLEMDEGWCIGNDYARRWWDKSKVVGEERRGSESESQIKSQLSSQNNLTTWGRAWESGIANLWWNEYSICCRRLELEGGQAQRQYVDYIRMRNASKKAVYIDLMKTRGERHRIASLVPSLLQCVPWWD